MKTGITGHQNLGSPGTVSWVQGALLDAITRFRVTEGFSCLAEGADQLFAELLIERGIPFTAVIPSADYTETFLDAAAREIYLSLLGQAADRIQQPFPVPSEEAFNAAGQEVVRRSDLLIGVWNGKPARGLGGTADIIEFARSHGRLVFHLNPETRSTTELFAGFSPATGTHGDS